jgi:hypothetical protein
VGIEQTSRRGKRRLAVAQRRRERRHPDEHLAPHLRLLLLQLLLPLPAVVVL